MDKNAEDRIKTVVRRVVERAIQDEMEGKDYITGKTIMTKLPEYWELRKSNRRGDPMQLRKIYFATRFLFRTEAEDCREDEDVEGRTYHG